jgi:hypothetical protein
LVAAVNEMHAGGIMPDVPLLAAAVNVGREVETLGPSFN